MPGDSPFSDDPERPIVVPELRDYHQINAELVRRLDRGAAFVRLEGVENQRLLVSRLKGEWSAVVEVQGNAGPELAAELDAPGLTVVCRGNAADGAGRDLGNGRLLIQGRAGIAVGYFQRGGTLIVQGPVGPRAGLGQRGGDLFLLNASGPLAGERQSGGSLFLHARLAGPHQNRGRRGGSTHAIDDSERSLLAAEADAMERYHRAIALVDRFLSAS